MNTFRSLPEKFGIDKTKLTPKTVGLGALTVLCVVVILIALGNQLRVPWPLSLQYESPSKTSLFEVNSADGSSNLMAVVVDQQNSRLSLIDADGTVCFVTELTVSGSGSSQYSTVAADARGYYFTEALSFTDSSYLASEQVYFCAGVQQSAQLVYERTYEETDKVFNPLFFEICTLPDGSDTMLVCQSANKSEIELVSLAAQPGQTVATFSSSGETSSLSAVAFSPVIKTAAIISRAGELSFANAAGQIEKVAFPQLCYFSCCIWDNKGLLYCIDAVDGSLVCIDPQTKEELYRESGQRYTCIGISPSSELLVCGTENGLTVFSAQDFFQGMSDSPTPLHTTDTAVPYSWSFSAWTIIIWLAIAYLVVCVAVLLVRLIIKMFRRNQREILIRALLIGLSVLAIVGISVFYTNQFYVFAEQSRSDVIGGLCQSGVKSTNAVCQSEAFENIDTSSLSDEQKRAYIDAIGKALQERSSSFADYSVSLKMALMMAVGDEVVTLVADADGYGVQRFVPDFSQWSYDESALVAAIMASPDRAVCGVETNKISQNLTATQGIFTDAGEFIGFLKVYSDVSDLIVSYRNLCVGMVMTLLAAAAVLILLFFEGKAVLEAWKMRRREQQKQGGHPEVWSTRQLNFWVGMAWSFDATLNVLVAKEMLEANGAVGVDVLVGLPAMLSALGGFVGIALFSVLSSRITGRKLSVMGVCGAAVFFVLSSFAVAMNAFWAFCALRFFGTLCLALPDGIVSVLPLRTPDEKTRAQLFRDYAMASISGAALGGIACGYVSEYLGNSVIYLVCLIPCAFILLVSILGLPKRAVFVDEKRDGKKRSEKGKSLGIFARPAVLSLLICVSLPILLLDGYKSILFPLFMSDAGLPKTYINNIIVFADVLVFAISPQLSKVIDDVDQWLVVVFALLFGAAALVWFLVNGTIAWSILVLVLLGLSYRMCSPGVSLLLPREARACGMSETKANNTFSIASNLVCAIPSPVLSSLAALGQSIACAIVGAVCAVAALIFALVTRNSAMRVDSPASVSLEASEDAAGEKTFACNDA